MTGKPVNRKKHHPGPVINAGKLRPDLTVPKRQHSTHHHAGKFRLSKLFRRIFNAESAHKRKIQGIRVVNFRNVENSGSFSKEPALTREYSPGPSSGNTESFDGLRRKKRKRKSFFNRLFKASKPKTERLVFPAKRSKSDFLNALPAEGFALLNSAGLYILSYLVIYLAYQLSGILAASVYGIDSVLFYYELYFPIGNASPLWTRMNIIAITMVGPFISVLISILLFKVVLIREKLNPQLRLFLLWVAFHGATHFLGAFVAGIVTSQGFGYVANWMYMNVAFRIMVSLIFLFLLTLSGYFSTTLALETIPPGIRQQRWRLSMSLGSRLIFPWIIGGLLIVAVKYPNALPQHENIMIYDAVIIASMGFMIIPAFFNYKAKPRSVAERPHRLSRPPGVLMISIALVTLILFRLTLERGIYFLIRFTFDMGFYR